MRASVSTFAIGARAALIAVGISIGVGSLECGAAADQTPTVGSDYRKEIGAWLAAHKRYPEDARGRGEEGRAVLRFRVNREGRVLDAAVISSTGFADLDAAVVDMMHNAVLPPFPSSMTEPEIEVSVQIRFGLTEPGGRPASTTTAPDAVPAPPSPTNQTSSLDEVSLKQSGGVYRVPVRINDAFTLDFTLDSGATDVQIPADVVLTLMRTETLSSTDFIGSQTYQLADGSKLPSVTVMLRELKVGNHRLQNVKAAIGPIDGGLLLGQSFLARFKAWTLDNDRHVLVLVEH
jgi:TonB family protein